MGQLDRLRTELPESAEPIVPKHWGELNTVTIAFGHGLSVAPLQAVMGIAATLNGGRLIPPTFLKRDAKRGRRPSPSRCSSPRPAAQMRYLMRLNAEKGTATKANVAGYYIGGKTGTAEKVVNGRYSKTQAADRFHGRAAGRQAEISDDDHARRAAADAGNPRLCHRRLERRADRAPR